MSALSFTWLAWMAGTVSVFWLSPARWRTLVLAAVTLAFLAIHSPPSAVILVLFTLFTYYGTRADSPPGWRVALVAAALLLTLAYYKIRVHQATDADLVGAVGIPLGLSYYTFRCIHYVFERYRGTLAAQPFQHYLSYLFFIPTMLVGPINRAQPFFDDLRGHTWSSEHVSRGIERILYGYAKITILSGLLVNRLLDGYIASLPEDAGALRAYLTIVRNGLDLYFLFAGYSDIAIGFGRLLGFRIMENFRWPYLQKNISDFWRCWHISLSSWCRDYIYLPVVGLTRNPYLATLATFTAIGLWHELSYRYILWGLWHGVGIVLWRRFQELKRAARLPKVKHPAGRLAVDAASIALTLHYVFLGLVIVTEESLTEAGRVYYTVLFGW